MSRISCSRFCAESTAGQQDRDDGRPREIRLATVWSRTRAVPERAAGTPVCLSPNVPIGDAPERAPENPSQLATPVMYIGTSGPTLTRRTPGPPTAPYSRPLGQTQRSGRCPRRATARMGTRLPRRGSRRSPKQRRTSGQFRRRVLAAPVRRETADGHRAEARRTPSNSRRVVLEPCPHGASQGGSGPNNTPSPASPESFRMRARQWVRENLKSGISNSEVFALAPRMTGPLEQQQIRLELRQELGLQPSWVMTDRYRSLARTGLDRWAKARWPLTGLICYD